MGQCRGQSAQHQHRDEMRYKLKLLRLFHVKSVLSILDAGGEVAHASEPGVRARGVGLARRAIVHLLRAFIERIGSPSRGARRLRHLIHTVPANGRSVNLSVVVEGPLVDVA